MKEQWNKLEIVLLKHSDLFGFQEVLLAAPSTGLYYHCYLVCWCLFAGYFGWSNSAAIDSLNLNLKYIYLLVYYDS